ncbi:MAG: LexA family transcriptional regulator [Clostridia bacterium]|nr:LexA family transcriptional regulator [Clostridia bacterium]MDY5559087.1 LexA family transcriptional regulator [Candidatus Heritagella sp.]
MGSSPDSSFPQRLREALESSVYNTSTLGAKLGLSRQTISAYLTGARVPKEPTLRALAEVLRVSDQWLMGKDVPRARLDPADILAAPGLGTAPALQKKPLFPMQDPALPVPEFCPCDVTLLCPDDSMQNERLRKGDMLYIRLTPHIENDQLAAVQVGNTVLIRRWYRKGSAILLQSGHPAFPPLLFSGDERDGLRPIGIVTGFTARFD